MSSIPSIAAMLLLVGMLASAEAPAQEKFPSRPIEIIVPTPAGGSVDIIVRLVGEAVEPILGQKVVIVNKPGGGGTIGMSALAQARADGYTLGGLWNGPLTMTPHSQAVPYTSQDFVALALIDNAPLVMCTRPDFPANSGKEFVDQLRASPNKYTYGTEGVASTIQLSTERVFARLGIKARAVPFGGGGETLKNFLGGHLDFYSGSLPPIVAQVKAGAAKCLLLTSKEKHAAVPQAASLTDVGVPDAATYVWHGIIAPKGVPPERLAILEKAFVQVTRNEKFRQAAEATGVTVVGAGTSEFRDLIDTEYKAMGDIVTALGLGKK